MKLFALAMVLCSEPQFDDMIGNYFDACDEYHVAVYEKLDDCAQMMYAFQGMHISAIPYVSCVEVEETNE